MALVVVPAMWLWSLSIPVVSLEWGPSSLAVSLRVLLLPSCWQNCVDQEVVVHPVERTKSSSCGRLAVVVHDVVSKVTVKRYVSTVAVL